MGIGASKKDKKQKNEEVKKKNLRFDTNKKENINNSNLKQKNEEIKKKNLEFDTNKKESINNSNLKQKNEKETEIKTEIETLKIILNDNLPSPKKWDENKIWSFGYQKTFLGYLNAYFDHCPIKVSPNVIWQLILNKFSRYVNDYSEELREHFVNFKGKKDLTCIRIGTFKDIYKYEDDIIEEFCNKISENIGSELTEALTPNFSTSTKESIIAGKVSIMSTFKKYFRYRVGMCTCGIPYIILEGNLEDWEKILKKLKTLGKCGFYTSKMEDDILKIIDTKKGKIDLDFWRTIIMETKTIVTEEKNCMTYKTEKNIITGWILDFYKNREIIEKGKNEYKMDEEVINAPITLKNLETGETKDGTILAGIRDLKQDPINFIVEPIVNYCLSFDRLPFHNIEMEEF